MFVEPKRSAPFDQSRMYNNIRTDDVTQCNSRDEGIVCHRDSSRRSKAKLFRNNDVECFNTNLLTGEMTPFMAPCTWENGPLYIENSDFHVH